MEIKRKKFQGVLNILSFNRHFYIIGLIVLFLILLLFLLLDIPKLLFYVVGLSFFYGLLMPLIVSAYVYDYSGYYNLDWLNDFKIQDNENSNFVNINAGFDETSFIIKNKFPKSNLRVFDFYDEKKHTEPAIIRARKVSLVYPNTKPIRTYHIPLSDNSVDVIFLLSAIHEIRNDDEKVTFLEECKRICKPNGKIIMVEHLRDFNNFFAFSIGFTHFFSRKTWRNVFKKAGFSKLQETKFTSFMSIFTTVKKI